MTMILPDKDMARIRLGIYMFIAPVVLYLFSTNYISGEVGLSRLLSNHLQPDSESILFTYLIFSAQTACPHPVQSLQSSDHTSDLSAAASKAVLLLAYPMVRIAALRRPSLSSAPCSFNVMQTAFFNSC